MEIGDNSNLLVIISQLSVSSHYVLAWLWLDCKFARADNWEFVVYALLSYDKSKEHEEIWD